MTRLSTYDHPVHRLAPEDSLEGLRAEVAKKRERERIAREERQIHERVKKSRNQLITWAELEYDILPPVAAVLALCFGSWWLWRGIAWFVTHYHLYGY